MPRADRLKEEIGWRKISFGVLTAIDASLFGWLAQNGATAGWALLLAGSLAAAAVSAVVARVNRVAYRRMDELENA